MRIFEEVFHLRPGATELAITQEALTTLFRSAFPKGGLSSLDLETRSLLQTLYYVSHGVEVPADHQARGLVTVTRDAAGQPFDWHVVMRDLFHVPPTGGKGAAGQRPCGGQLPRTLVLRG